MIEICWKKISVQEQRWKKHKPYQLTVAHKPLQKLHLKWMDLDGNKSPLFQHDPGHYKSAQAKWDIRLLSELSFHLFKNQTERSRLIPLILDTNCIPGCEQVTA